MTRLIDAEALKAAIPPSISSNATVATVWGNLIDNQPTVPATVVPPPVPVPAVTPFGNALVHAAAWNLIFQDEFDGPALDLSKWSTGWFGSGVTAPVGGIEESAAYSPTCASVSTSTLKLSADKRNMTVNGHTYPYTSGLVSTNGKHSFTSGYFEAKITLPASSAGKIANFPAFWLDGQNWPADGEIDIMEGLGGLASYHTHYPAGATGSTSNLDYTGTHVYAAYWDGKGCTFFYDGVRVGAATLPGTSGSPMYIVLNYGVGGAGGVSQPGVMAVDYVRVWQ